MKFYLRKHIKSWKLDQRFNDTNTKNTRLLFYALIVGLIVGLAGSIFRIVLGYIEVFRDDLYKNANNSGFLGWITPILFAIIGISIALFLVRKFAPETSGSGVQEIEGALDGIRPIRWKRVLPIKFFASLFSLGSGLLLGREGPTIQIGANIGKMIKDALGKSDTEDNPLISAGAAAGLASAFNAPFAGIIFIIEEMHEHFRFNFYSVAAIMIGAGTADFVVRSLVGANPIIQMVVYSSPGTSELWLFIILGLLFSVIGYLYNKLLVLSLDFFQISFKVPLIFTGIIAGIIIAVIGITFPEMIGGGYSTITEVLNHSFSLSFLLILFIIRMVLSIFSYSTGVPGGIFAPLLTLGVILGMLYGGVMQHYFPDLISHPGIFAVAGMAGIFASTVRAPLTGLVLAVEMTLNFELILPLIITTITASVITVLLGNKPIYATLLKRTISNTNH
ncbi:H(+)/Cl(-) exchange transporter ClcA [Lutibacter sp.]|uniref:H(+)/Cl(-) exchange transporter ClcA n=1 Tax=Lutibacter sp. TaxID=1925666 RepID=UPI0025C159D0|nr:H(+)/Cl(-) exchange transporter ClcA [Lutibacter sp.]MCF6168300.1 H(+)/Cl(-) exchange transporter ClcA [Lutibacter sp.]